jgi:peptidoglycan/LPS O-acetylase OafA/YrhL
LRSLGKPELRKTLCLWPDLADDGRVQRHAHAALARPSPGAPEWQPGALPAERRNIHFDALRGGAALLVMFGHLRGIVLEDWTRSGHPIMWAPLYYAAGFARYGVILFFLLSGLLVTQSAHRALRAGTWTLRGHVIQRWLRLATVAYPALFAGFCLDRIGLSVVGNRSVYSTAPSAAALWGGFVVERSHLATYVGNLAFVQTVLIPPAGSNGSLWSLCNEFWYYVLFGLVVCAWRTRATGSRILCIAAAVGILGLSALPGAGFGHYPWRSDVLPLLGTWALGAAVAYLIERWRGVRPSRALHWAALLLAAGTALVLRGVIVSPRWRLVADYAQAFATTPLLLLLGMREGHGSRWYLRSARFTATISYSLYATHLPLVYLMMGLSFDERIMPNARGLFILAAMVIACLAYAVAFYWAFERHTARLRRAVRNVGNSGGYAKAVRCSG